MSCLGCLVYVFIKFSYYHSSRSVDAFLNFFIDVEGKILSLSRDDEVQSIDVHGKVMGVRGYDIGPSPGELKNVI